MWSLILLVYVLISFMYNFNMWSRYLSTMPPSPATAKPTGVCSCVTPTGSPVATLANLSHCSDEEIRALKLALKHKGQLTHVRDLREGGTRQGLAVGAVWVLPPLAKRRGLVKALGQSRTAKLALWLVFGGVISASSPLS